MRGHLDKLHHLLSLLVPTRSDVPYFQTWVEKQNKTNIYIPATKVLGNKYCMRNSLYQHFSSSTRFQKTETSIKRLYLQYQSSTNHVNTYVHSLKFFRNCCMWQDYLYILKSGYVYLSRRFTWVSTKKRFILYTCIYNSAVTTQCVIHPGIISNSNIHLIVGEMWVYLLED